MAEKKEVLDYLRNQQKAAEIEAKMNGVNIWVLLGAIAVVGWQLTSVLAVRLWSDYELIVRTLTVAITLHMLAQVLSKSGDERDELRYSQFKFSEVNSPFLLFFSELLIFIPPAILWMIAGMSFTAFILSFFGALGVIMSFISIFHPLFVVNEKSGKFPRPDFGMTKRSTLALGLIFGIFLIAALIQQIAYFFMMRVNFNVEDAKSILLLAALYILVLITVIRKRQNNSIAWTYDLETDIILGVISPEVAIRKIENRRLGPRLHDIMDRFFDDLDQGFAEVKLKLIECEKKINEAKQIPEQYATERAARIRAASEDVESRINIITEDCKEFREYLQKLEQMPSGGRKVVVPQVLVNLKARYEIYSKHARKAKQELDRLLD